MTRTGKVVPLVKTQLNTNKLKVLEKKYGKVTELREYSNGRVGAFFGGGQFRLVGGKCKKERKTIPVKKLQKSTKCKCKKSCKCGNNPSRKSAYITKGGGKVKKSHKLTKSPERSKSPKKTKKQFGGRDTMGLQEAVAHLRQHYYNL